MAYTPKTKATKQSVTKYLNSIEDDAKRKDAKALHKIMTDVTGEKAELWGNSIVGYGSYHYKTRSNCEGDWPLVGFSPRKGNLAIYIMPGFAALKPQMEKLGNPKHGVSCLYLKSLDGVHLPSLKKMIKYSHTTMQKRSVAI